MADIQKLYEQWLAKATADPDLKAELESIKDDEDGKNEPFLPRPRVRHRRSARSYRRRHQQNERLHR